MLPFPNTDVYFKQWLWLVFLLLLFIGGAGVGKTALVSQFMTSEYMNTYDASLGKKKLDHTLSESGTFMLALRDRCN